MNKNLVDYIFKTHINYCDSIFNAFEHKHCTLSGINDFIRNNLSNIFFIPACNFFF